MHIALSAAMITIFSYYAYHLEIDTTYVVFVGSSTLLTYSIHRLIGMKKVATYSQIGRYAIVVKYRHHILIYALLSALVCLYLFFSFSVTRQLYLVLCGCISLLYTLPIFSNGKRLRDFSMIKIFLIALVWAFVTDGLLLLESGAPLGDIALSMIVRGAFVLAITIPFDIRDMDVDREIGVATIPSRYGIKKSKRLSLLLILSCLGVTFYLGYSIIIQVSMIITYITAATLIIQTSTEKRDIWYSGYLDGAIMLPLIAYCVLQYVRYLFYTT